MTSYVDLAKEGAFKGYFVANAKVLYDKIDFGFSMIGEMLNHSIPVSYTHLSPATSSS